MHISIKTINLEFQMVGSVIITIFFNRVMLQSQIILQHFYKMLIWPISYWFSSKSTINITFSFTNNYSPHQQFVKKICRIVCIFSIILDLIFNTLDLIC